MKYEHKFEIGSLKVNVTGEAEFSEKELQACIWHLSGGRSVFRHEGYTDGENTLAAIIATRDLYNNVSCEPRVETEEFREAMLEELVTPFEYSEAQMDEILYRISWADMLYDFDMVDDDVISYAKDKSGWAPTTYEDGEEESFETAFITFVKENYGKDKEFTTLLLESMEEDSRAHHPLWAWPHSDIAEQWQERCYEREVYEWWEVDADLARDLKECGEIIVDGLWARMCSGQSVLLDGTLQDVARLRINRLR